MEKMICNHLLCSRSYHHILSPQYWLNLTSTIIQFGQVNTDSLMTFKLGSYLHQKGFINSSLFSQSTDYLGEFLLV